MRFGKIAWGGGLRAVSILSIGTSFGAGSVRFGKITFGAEVPERRTMVG